MVGIKQNLVVIGDGETAELAYDYFSKDTTYKVVGFSAETAFKRHQILFGLPVVPLEEVEAYFDPNQHEAFVGVSYTNLNRLRCKLFDIVKKKGYTFCSYISPKAYVGTNVTIGKNCFILENVTLQRGVAIGDNVTIWSGSSVGHRTIVGDNCFIASHVAISGFCEIGENCFLGVNSCIIDKVKIEKNCIIGAGAVVINNVSEGRIYVGNPAKQLQNKQTDIFFEGKEAV
ncbi:MAG: acetyltransferase [Candidatus Bathyarchaeia archaeon]|jgi:sugar O-acyltransferase (sialic acid O-acetyltransferase NeuD family)